MKSNKAGHLHIQYSKVNIKKTIRGTNQNNSRHFSNRRESVKEGLKMNNLKNSLNLDHIARLKALHNQLDYEIHLQNIPSIYLLFLSPFCPQFSNFVTSVHFAADTFADIYSLYQLSHPYVNHLALSNSTNPQILSLLSID